MKADIPAQKKINTRLNTELDLGAVSKILEKYERSPGNLIAILQEIQLKYKYLPEKALRMVADRTGRALVDVYGVATFYHSFSLNSRGKHHISVCLGTACHVRGAARIIEEFERQLKIKPGETTPDREFTLETVNCLGACALGPIVVIDGFYFSHVTASRVKLILKEARRGLDRKDISKDIRFFPISVNCPRCNHSLMDFKHMIDGYPSIRMTISFERKHCSLSLSSIYGSYNIICEEEIPLDAVINFFCPHCYGTLQSPMNCPECGAPMIPLIVQGGGIHQICSRRGCKEHRLDLSGVNV